MLRTPVTLPFVMAVNPFAVVPLLAGNVPQQSSKSQRGEMDDGDKNPALCPLSSVACRPSSKLYQLRHHLGGKERKRAQRLGQRHGAEEQIGEEIIHAELVHLPLDLGADGL